MCYIPMYICASFYLLEYFEPVAFNALCSFLWAERRCFLYNKIHRSSNATPNLHGLTFFFHSLPCFTRSLSLSFDNTADTCRQSTELQLTLNLIRAKQTQIIQQNEYNHNLRQCSAIGYLYVTELRLQVFAIVVTGSVVDDVMILRANTMKTLFNSILSVHFFWLVDFRIFNQQQQAITTT